MTNLLIRGGFVVTPSEDRFADVWTERDRIADVGSFSSEERGYQIVDASGCYVTPGLIDLQVNGGPPCDFWAEPSVLDVANFSEQLMAHGVTSILPTLITGDMQQLVRTRDFLKVECGAGAVEQTTAGMVRMPGLHLEGPFLSPQRPGVHPPQFLQSLQLELVQEVVDDSVKLITLAPELDPEGTCLKWLQTKGVQVALGHSNATLEEARLAFDRGTALMTHTFNALPPLHHRTPGAVCAALLDRRVTCCMICDGLHINPAAAELILRCKGVESTILVTDIAKVGTSQGGLVGASLYLNEAVLNVVQWGIASFSEAIRMSTLNPARALGMENKIGTLTRGAYADILLWDKKTLALKQVFFNGRQIELQRPAAIK